MKIAIIGYGRMGKEIEAQAEALNIPIACIIDNAAVLENTSFDKDVVAIEFTQPDACLNNYKILANKGVSVVTGTTGWYDELASVKNLIEASNTGFLYASNFSIGVHLFWQIVGRASQLMNAVEDYDVFMHEFHHKDKKDSPSGTAITTAEIILGNLERKKKIHGDKFDRAPAPDELHVSSTRGGHIIGRHSVFMDGAHDSIEITHDAKDRGGFTLGALYSAQWLHGKKGFYSIEDYLEERFA